MWLLALTGCINTVWFPPDLWAWDSGRPWDTGLQEPTSTSSTTPPEDDGEIGVATVSGACDAQGLRWIVVTDGWVGFGTLNVFDVARGLAEEHPLFIYASDPGGAWDELRVGPLRPPDTQFTCPDAAADLSYVARVRDGDGALLDCVVWGADPQGATARIRNLDPDVLALGGCSLVSVGP